MKISTFLFLCLFFASNITAFSQPDMQLPTGRDAAIDVENIDFKLLEHFVKREIDNVRKKLNLDTLMNDSILYQAAADHADYLKTIKKLSHNQQNSKKRTPMKRAKYYGAVNYVIGENIVSSPFHYPIQYKFKTVSLAHNTQTYKQVAYDMMIAWIHSPGHYENIKTKKFSATGVAVAFKPDTYEFIAVQVFGIVPKNYIQQNSTKYFPYENNTDEESIPTASQITLPDKIINYEYSLKSPKYLSDYENVMKLSQKFTFRDGYIQCDYKTAKKLFRGCKSGITFETVNFEDYTTKKYHETPTRRNQRNLFNGKLSKPRYRRELFKEAKKNEKRERFEIFGIKTPFKKNPKNFIIREQPSRNGQVDNLIIIKRKRVYRIFISNLIHYEFFDFPFAQIPYYNDFKKTNYPLNANKDSMNIYRDTLELTIRFQKNKHHVNEKHLQPILEYIKNTDAKITHANIRAYASIEGTIEQNEKLYKKRAANFLEIFKSVSDSGMIMTVNTNENWEMFFEQIPSTKYAFLKKKKKKDVKKYINKNAKKRDVENLLAEQRYAYIQLITRKDEIIEFDKNQYNHNMINKYNFGLLKVREKRLSNKRKVVDDLLKMQASFFTGYINGDVTAATIRLMNTEQLYNSIIYKNRDFAELIYNDLIFKYFYFEEKMSKKEFYNKIQKLGNLKEKSSAVGNFKRIPRNKLMKKIIHNNQVFLLNNIDEYTSKLIRDKTMSFAEKGNPEAEQIRFKNEKEKKENWLAQKVIVLNEILLFSQNAKKFNITKNIIDSLTAFYNVYMIKSMYNKSYIKYKKTIDKKLTFIYKYFVKNKVLSDEEHIKFAKYFLAFEKNKWIEKLLKPIIFCENPNYEAYILYLKFKVYTSISDAKIFEIFCDAKQILTKKEWCDIFTDSHHFDFQILDKGRLRYLYCKTCGCD